MKGDQIRAVEDPATRLVIEDRFEHLGMHLVFDPVSIEVRIMAQ